MKEYVIVVVMNEEEGVVLMGECDFLFVVDKVL